MQIDIVLGDLARRDALVVAGDDWRVMLTAYSPSTPNPIDLDGDIRLVIFKGNYDAMSIDGAGTKPTVFDIPASATTRRVGRWQWRIERTQNDLRTTLVLGILVIQNPGDR